MIQYANIQLRTSSIMYRANKFINVCLKSISYRLLLVITSMIMTIGCRDTVKNANKLEERAQPTKVIFETDMGNDIDDALALDMLYKYADENKIEILAISVNKDNDYAWRYIDILNTWYGYPNIPIGMVEKGVSGNNEKNYAQATWEHQSDGEPSFRGVVDEYENLPNSIQLYRKILSQQPDTSVVVISVGFSTNIARLLDTEPDEFSNLSGVDLISKKVKMLSAMAGDFSENPIKEFNVVQDINAAQKVFGEWPTPIIVSPFEVGNEITYPASSIENDFNWVSYHPVVVAYENYMSMPYDRPTWDLTSVIYAIEENDGYFSTSGVGQITVDDQGYTNFIKKPNGKHQYLKINSEQANMLKHKFIQIISTKPKKYVEN